MSNKTNKLIELYNKIDDDSGLQSKRRILTIASLILLAIQFSGAKVIEANTLILKLHFEHQSGIALLLVCSIIFLLIRYYNYAKQYHNTLYSIWSDELLGDNTISWHCHHSDDISGLLHEKYPEGFGYDYPQHTEEIRLGFSYECKTPFRRFFRYTRTDQYDEISNTTNIFKELGLKKYLLILTLEFKYQFSRYFTHRENLDILAPYFLGGIAVCSYIFHAEFQSLIKLFLVK